MPSVRYYNQTAPFWDFVANFEQQAGNRGETSDEENEHPNPWSAGWAGTPWGPFPHRGRHGHHHHPAPPPHHEGPSTSAPADEEQGPEAGPSEPKGPPNDNPEDGPRRRGHHGHGHGPHRGGPWARGGGGCGRGGRGFGSRGRSHHFHPYASGPWAHWAEMFQNQLFGGGEEGTSAHAGAKDGNVDDFKPEADVFDTAESFVVHVSLPGAKKEDVGVNWDAEKSELSIAGVVYRPGDEEFLKSLALDERKIGAFERKVRLGSRANPAQVDVDGITARMEDGVLTVEVPKLDSGYVEIKKVDID